MTLLNRLCIICIKISTHTSLAGRDSIRSTEKNVDSLFLLTRPSRDVTLLRMEVGDVMSYISTHTSLAGRDGPLDAAGHPIRISTHTSLAGRDLLFTYLIIKNFIFLLTRPSRDVTCKFFFCFQVIVHFYSHVPRGT